MTLLYCIPRTRTVILFTRLIMSFISLLISICSFKEEKEKTVKKKRKNQDILRTKRFDPVKKKSF